MGKLPGIAATCGLLFSQMAAPLIIPGTCLYLDHLSGSGPAKLESCIAMAAWNRTTLARLKISPKHDARYLSEYPNGKADYFLQCRHKPVITPDIVRS